MARENALRIPMYLMISIVLFITTTTCFVDSKTTLKKNLYNDLLQFLQKNQYYMPPTFLSAFLQV